MDTILLILLWGLGSICLLLPIIIIILNYVATIVARKIVSPIPLVGGVLGVMVLAMIPLSVSWYYLLLPLVLDIGTLPVLMAMTVDCIILHSRKKDTTQSQSFADILAKRLGHEGIIYANDEAAKIIRDFVNSISSQGPHEWDDFESVRHKNPDTDLAKHLCWYFARLYPPRKGKAEYCAPEAMPYFIAVAKCLESGQLHPFANATTIGALKHDELPPLKRTMPRHMELPPKLMELLMMHREES